MSNNTITISSGQCYAAIAPCGCVRAVSHLEDAPRRWATEKPDHTVQEMDAIEAVKRMQERCPHYPEAPE